MEPSDTLTSALRTEARLDAEEDRLLDEQGRLIRAQRDALARGDDAAIETLGEQIHAVTMRRRAVRA